MFVILLFSTTTNKNNVVLQEQKKPSNDDKQQHYSSSSFFFVVVKDNEHNLLFFQVLEHALDNNNKQHHSSYFLCQKTFVFITLIVFVHCFLKVLPLCITTTNDNDERSSVHCHLFFFTCYLQRVSTSLVVLCFAFAAQLVVIFFLFYVSTDGSPFLNFSHK